MLLKSPCCRIRIAIRKHPLSYLSGCSETSSSGSVQRCVPFTKLRLSQLLWGTAFDQTHSNKCRKTIEMPLVAFERNTVCSHHLIDDLGTYCLSNRTIRSSFGKRCPRHGVAHVIGDRFEDGTGKSFVNKIVYIVESHASNIIYRLLFCQIVVLEERTMPSRLPQCDRRKRMLEYESRFGGSHESFTILVPEFAFRDLNRQHRFPHSPSRYEN